MEAEQKKLRILHTHKVHDTCQPRAQQLSQLGALHPSKFQHSTNAPHSSRRPSLSLPRPQPAPSRHLPSSPCVAGNPIPVTFTIISASSWKQSRTALVCLPFPNPDMNTPCMTAVCVCVQVSLPVSDAVPRVSCLDPATGRAAGTGGGGEGAAVCAAKPQLHIRYGAPWGLFTGTMEVVGGTYPRGMMRHQCSVRSHIHHASPAWASDCQRNDGDCSMLKFDG